MGRLSLALLWGRLWWDGPPNGPGRKERSSSKVGFRPTTAEDGREESSMKETDLHEPPYADPLARWSGGRGLDIPGYPIGFSSGPRQRPDDAILVADLCKRPAGTTSGKWHAGPAVIRPGRDCCG